MGSTLNTFLLPLYICATTLAAFGCDDDATPVDSEASSEPRPDRLTEPDARLPGQPGPVEPTTPEHLGEPELRLEMDGQTVVGTVARQFTAAAPEGWEPVGPVFALELAETLRGGVGSLRLRPNRLLPTEEGSELPGWQLAVVNEQGLTPLETRPHASSWEGRLTLPDSEQLVVVMLRPITRPAPAESCRAWAAEARELIASECPQLSGTATVERLAMRCAERQLQGSSIADDLRAHCQEMTADEDGVSQ